MEENRVPKHIGIIMDGNRRFAKKLMLKPWMGHEWGAKKVQKILDWCQEAGIQELTLYAFSVQNFNRPKEEFDYLMNVFHKEFDNLMSSENQEKLKRQGLQISFIGRTWMFAPDIQEKMRKLMDMTKNNTKHRANFAMAYGGREEVIDAVKKIGEQMAAGKLTVDQINEEVFAANLYRNSDPELIIRTGGDKRTSNFLIWQSNYSEWFFIEKTWPEFEKEDLVKCINEFGQRERRFGK
ncbi:MAG: di-trans,poly-cis-decaprenylcistransferase [Candidatus Aenigmarchaeota archaeon]|nr:di-trans,poly-cis-decaprenylcistransferase [Candidatus Aenigmarchaeota archaeon]